jgi:hypothetical protein
MDSQEVKKRKKVMLNLIQHLTESRTYETLKEVQGDNVGLFKKPSFSKYQILWTPVFTEVTTLHCYIEKWTQRVVEEGSERMGGGRSLLFNDPLLPPKPIKFFLVRGDPIAIREDEDVLVT